MNDTITKVLNIYVDIIVIKEIATLYKRSSFFNPLHPGNALIKKAFTRSRSVRDIIERSLEADQYLISPFASSNRDAAKKQSDSMSHVIVKRNKDLCNTTLICMRL